MLTALQISEIVEGKLFGDSELVIHRITALENTTSHSAVYVSHAKHLEDLNSTSNVLVITTEQFANCCDNAVVVTNPQLAIAKLSQAFVAVTPKISTRAIISSTATIGENTTIGAGCVIGENVHVGKNCYIYPNVSIMENVVIGDNCVISSGAVIGSQGFGNAFDGDKWHAIYHTGGVEIGSDVTIGANTTIDSGTFSPTIIHSGVRLDNLIHIAHNVIIGEHTAIAAKVGIAGSTTIGKYCQIGGMVGIVGHLTIADNVVIYATSTVNKSITKKGVYTGFLPIMPHATWKKVAFLLTKFDKIVKLLKIKITQL